MKNQVKNSRTRCQESTVSSSSRSGERPWMLLFTPSQKWTIKTKHLPPQKASSPQSLSSCCSFQTSFTVLMFNFLLNFHTLLRFYPESVKVLFNQLLPYFHHKSKNFSKYSVCKTFQTSLCNLWLSPRKLGKEQFLTSVIVIRIDVFK